ncbi:LAME_0H18316g1_1 [Lachancea meyersii CBS 8951]|uniref:LAME_0H18316g1_1 n=1 Tax=Lachancea meyersii CBS 8951 TaxID=1266667 RepID=A0A1G4KIT3_9SACH|nr:LAME_0H18316g1_1 [Lachancea meyersii CBS 8951]
MSTHALRIPEYALGHYSPNDKVVITGSFDNWEHMNHILEFNDSEKSYVVTIPGGDSDSIIFKFVINDKEWVCLPYFETQIDSRGLVNNILRWQDYTDECLDNITISSAAPGPENPPERPRTQTSDGSDGLAGINAEFAASKSECAPFATSPGPRSALQATQSSPVEHDYIHVSSQDELSSTENLDLTFQDSCGSAGEPVAPGSSHDSRELQEESPPSSQKRLQSLVSVVKRVKMYWSG